MTVKIGSFSGPIEWRKINLVQHEDQTDSLLTGDLVQSWGHTWEWGENCVSKNQATAWRQHADPLCDKALGILFPGISSSTGVDLFTALKQYTESTSSEDAAWLFYDTFSQIPPPDICVTEEEYKIAVAFFLDHAVQISQALSYYSLAGGFASPRIVCTLHAVSYLVPHGELKGVAGADIISGEKSSSDDRTYIRLNETFQFVLEVMGCMTPGVSRVNVLPGGDEWKATLRVRMLHGIARRRAQARLDKSDTGGIDFEPINQEDMSAILAAFSTIPLWCLSRYHLTPTPQQANAYLALWRHIGFYLGISPSILRRYLRSPATSDKFLASIAIHLFTPPPDSPTYELLPKPTMPILRAMSNRPGTFRTTLEYNCALSWYLLGDDLADHLSIPPRRFWTNIKLHLTLFSHRVPVYFSKYYPRRGWTDKRREMIREALIRVTRWNLGMRKTTFRPRNAYGSSSSEGADLSKGGVKGENGSEAGGEMAEGVVEEEKIEPDYEGGRRLVKSFRNVWLEMVGVLGLGVIVCGVAGWAGVQWCLQR